MLASAVDPFAAAPGLRAPRALLWGCFILVHGVLIWLCFVSDGWPLGDVEGVYLGWAVDAASGSDVVGITTGFVYPVLALLPILAALSFGPGAYSATWLGLVTLLNAGAFALLLGRGRRRAALLAAVWWLVFLLLLGPVALARIDAVTVPVAIVALLLVRTRPVWGTVLLTLATWVKIWPVALIAALFTVSKYRWQVAGAAVATSLGVVLVALGLGSGLNVLSFVTEQTNRGIQIESPVAAGWMWQIAWGTPGSHLYYDQEILTFQIIGPGANATIAAMTPLLVVCAAAVLTLAGYRTRSGADPVRLFPPLVLALVLTLIVVNKVGSPQFTAWLAAPVIVGLLVQGRAWRFPAVLVLLIAGLTQLIYPHLYDLLLLADPAMVLVLTVRNTLELVLLGWAVWQLLSPPAPNRRSNHAGCILRRPVRLPR
ncbi:MULTISPECIES: glycosyltransferase 87 family protein [Cryobacterium]|uniref:glycosyltransferase 87 family protein n=1 Tax=Cryobacterium TaxID=69578 RepID=UPI00141BA22C|nr:MULTISPECIES: glycosyltransferase 87 family protein [Cryobacterium]